VKLESQTVLDSNPVSTLCRLYDLEGRVLELLRASAFPPVRWSSKGTQEALKASMVSGVTVPLSSWWSFEALNRPNKIRTQHPSTCSNFTSLARSPRATPSLASAENQIHPFGCLWSF